MAFYSPSRSTFTRHYREEVAMAFSAIDCVLNGEPAIYASTELTSGKRLYDILIERGLRSTAELKNAMGAEWYETHVLNANTASAVAFARRIKAALEETARKNAVREEAGRKEAARKESAHKESEVITPAPFTAPGWSQPEYLAFWETLVRTRMSAVWFNTNWQYSNGCTFELAVAQDADLPTFDADGRPLGLREGVEAIEAAIAFLDAHGLDGSKLRENRERLVQLPRFAISTS
jgi:hypothetical protein